MSSPKKSSDTPLTPLHAWQPLTPRGVAAFAHATLTRLILVQLIVAAVFALAVILFLRIAWFPVITEAVQHLPETGVIGQGTLSFGASSPQSLAENARLAIVVDVDRERGAGRVADVAVTFEKNGLAICGAFGCWSLPYGQGYVISFNRPEVEPAWGAWQWPILAVAGIVTVLLLLLLWWSVAIVYLPLVKLIGFFADRAVTWRGAWKLSAATMLPGVFILTAGVVLYGFEAVDLLRFGLLYALHLLCGLVFVIASPWFLRRVGSAGDGRNPFGEPISKPEVRGKEKRPSPFSRREQK